LEEQVLYVTLLTFLIKFIQFKHRRSEILGAVWIKIYGNLRYGAA